jgi:hypothetical protein
MTDLAPLGSASTRPGLDAEDLYCRLSESPEEEAIEYLRTMLKLMAWARYVTKSVNRMHDRLTTTHNRRSEVSPRPMTD